MKWARHLRSWKVKHYVTKPQLEIFADDVKCTHGATVGRLDDIGLFYARSRGIPAAAAERLLTYAFAAEVIDEVTLEPVRLELDRLVLERLRG
jgi:Fe-S cluster assembly protein SufD